MPRHPQARGSRGDDAKTAQRCRTSSPNYHAYHGCGPRITCSIGECSSGLALDCRPAVSRATKKPDPPRARRRGDSMTALMAALAAAGPGEGHRIESEADLVLPTFKTINFL